MYSLQLLGGFILILVVSTYGFPSKPSSGKIWAFLVAGSDGYYNYRHQADVCHAYQILHSNGIPDENIIVMMADDIAYNSENPTPGVIINSPGGKDVYHGVPKDYTGKNVNPQTFLHVLTGNKSAVLGIGSGRVIESGPNDHIFVNFVDHGGPGVLCFPEEDLAADDLIKALKSMAHKSQFSKLVLYVEACESGSMFDNLLDDDLNIFVTTAADPFESSYACYYDNKRNTYLGDLFSVKWMEDVSSESLVHNDLHHQFERVRTRTNTSHVEEYGDLDIGNTKLKDVLGLNKKSVNQVTNEIKIDPTLDACDNLHVPIQTLKNQLEKYTDASKRKELKTKLRSLEKKRSEVDSVVEKIINNLLDLDENAKDEIRTGRHSLNKQNFPCYKKLYTLFSEKCFNLPKNPYVRIHLQKFINMCDILSLEVEKGVEAIENVCYDAERYVNFFAQ
ncbi:legumain-like isoform X3 [Rhodnius prolixus]|uniref:legumain n=1 Tax=Rhodnius prolixus TaxID=13249 RepID=R4FJQ6_RHOPR